MPKAKPDYRAIYMKHHDLLEDDWVACQGFRCNNTAVDIHHIQLKSQQGTDDIENLIPLCRPCHDEIHGKG